MSLIGKHIVVIGAGIGGLTAALAFAHRGARVTVLEQAETIKEVGAGLQISPNGHCVLRALGLGTALSDLAVKAQAVQLRDFRAGRLVTELNLNELDEAQSYFFVHRADLIGLLARSAREMGVSIRLLQKVKSVDPGTRPRVFLCNGDSLGADLVVGADGLHSVVRPLLNGVSKPFFTRQVAWRAIVPNRVDHPAIARVAMGPKRHLVSYPLCGGEWLNLVAVQERPQWAEEGWHHKDDPDNLRRAFADFAGDIPNILSEVKEVGLWGLFRHPVAQKWYGHGVAILGDAAHPTLPFMAQGAVMAIEDAWVLAQSIAETDAQDSGLALYQSRRMGRTRRIVETANGNAWKYHLSFPPLRFAAHNVMRAAGRIAPDRMIGQFDWIYRHDVTKVAS